MAVKKIEDKLQMARKNARREIKLPESKVTLIMRNGIWIKSCPTLRCSWTL